MYLTWISGFYSLFMPDATVKYYNEELVNWDTTLAFYEKESTELKSKLFGVIQQNTIPDRALRAEQFLSQLTLLHTELLSVSKQIFRQNNNLRKDDSALDDNAVTSKIRNDQNALRGRMQTLEKNFVDLKYACYNFFSRNT